MSTIGTGPGRVRAADDDIYTIMIVIAMLFLLVAMLYVGYRTVSLYGSLIPPGGS